MTASERIESIALVLFGVLGMSLWYNYWVVPNDKTRYAIMDCMGDDHTREAYEACREAVSDGE